MYSKELYKLLYRETINHKKQILENLTIKDALAYCKIHNINNSFGNLIEHYLCVKNKEIISRNKSSSCNGDISVNGETYELKCSLGGKSHDRFNFVQIRLNHECDYYILISYHLTFKNVNNNGDIYVFKIDKENMKKLIIKHGSYAHGSIKYFGKICENNLNYEYCLRPKYGDKCWKDLSRFRTFDFLV